MNTFLIISPSKEALEKEAEKLLSPFYIDTIDIVRITPEQSVGISSIRELKRISSLKPYRSQTKAIIIEEAQSLTIEAQNALLKTLEEPPEHTIIILLVSTNIDTLLPTVISRCQVIELPTTHYQLSKEEFSVLSSQFSVLIDGGIGERFAFVEKITKDRESATLWLAKMILATRQKLLKEISNGKNNHLISQYHSILISLQRAHALLSTTNVNPRLTLETLFLSL